jgi:hypothetical protein
MTQPIARDSIYRRSDVPASRPNHPVMCALVPHVSAELPGSGRDDGGAGRDRLPLYDSALGAAVYPGVREALVSLCPVCTRLGVWTRHRFRFEVALTIFIGLSISTARPLSPFSAPIAAISPLEPSLKRPSRLISALASETESRRQRRQPLGAAVVEDGGFPVAEGADSQDLRASRARTTLDRRSAESLL